MIVKNITMPCHNDMKQTIICEKIKLLQLLPELLLRSAEMHRCPSKTTNQSREEGLSAVNQPSLLLMC